MTLILISIHILLTILTTLMIFIKTGSIQDTISAFICLFMFPFAGFIILITYIIYRNIKLDSKIERESLLIKDESNYRFYNDLVLEDEINILPLNDVLLVSEDHIKRKRFLETIKKDVSRYTSYIKMALSNKDGETSHYAAAIIQETKRKMDVELQELMVEYRKNSQSYEFMAIYADFLISYLAIDVFEDSEKKRLSYEYINLTKKLIIKNKDVKYINYLINLLLDYNELDEARSFGHYYMDNYKDSYDKYLINMKIYNTIGDYETMMDVLDDFKRTDLVFDEKILNHIRFWMDGIS